MSWIAQRDDTLMTPLYLILSTVLSLVILLAVGIAILVVTNHREKLRIKNYSCADAQIRSKNAQKQEHRKMRKESDKMLYEVLLVNRDGVITEGSRSNVFFIKSGEVYTPPTDAVLPGVTRTMIIRILEEWKDKGGQ